MSAGAILLMAVALLLLLGGILMILLPKSTRVWPRLRARRRFDPGADNVSWSSDPVGDDDADPEDASVDYRLSELNRLLKQDQITLEEYRCRRRDLVGGR